MCCDTRANTKHKLYCYDMCKIVVGCVCAPLLKCFMNNHAAFLLLLAQSQCFGAGRRVTMKPAFLCSGCLVAFKGPAAEQPFSGGKQIHKAHRITAGPLRARLWVDLLCRRIWRYRQMRCSGNETHPNRYIRARELYAAPLHDGSPENRRAEALRG